MVDIAAIAAVTSSLKAAGDITKAAISLRDGQALQSKVIELNELILDAQRGAFSVHSEQFALIERVRDLERRIAGLEAWETTKSRYELHAWPTGVFTYRLKEGVEPAEPPHHICTECNQRGHMSVLHRDDDWHGNRLTCHRCKTHLRTTHKQKVTSESYVADRGGW